MLRVSPYERCSIDFIKAHPLFWTDETKLKYMGENIGMVVQTKNVRKTDNPFIADLERAMDSQVRIDNSSHCLCYSNEGLHSRNESCAK